MDTRVQGAEIKGPLARRHRRPKGLSFKRPEAQESMGSTGWSLLCVCDKRVQGFKGPRIQVSTDARVQDARSNPKQLPSPSH